MLRDSRALESDHLSRLQVVAASHYLSHTECAIVLRVPLDSIGDTNNSLQRGVK